MEVDSARDVYLGWRKRKSHDQTMSAVPRKRRIYDVLHVLEGAGMLRRVRREANGTRGKHYLYYGYKGTIHHLAEQESESARLIHRLRQTALSAPTRDEEDQGLIAMYEQQGARERWTLLTSVTVCLLGLLLQEKNRVPVSLALISHRLTQVKHVGGASSDDVSRRVYDIVSILASCRFVVTLCSSQSAEIPPSRRKHVRFNFTLFTESRCAESQLASDMQRYINQAQTSLRLHPDVPSELLKETPMRNLQLMPDGAASDSFKSSVFADGMIDRENVGPEGLARIEQSWVEPWSSPALSYQIRQDFLHSDMGISSTSALADIDFLCSEDLVAGGMEGGTTRL